MNLIQIPKTLRNERPQSKRKGEQWDREFKKFTGQLRNLENMRSVGLTISKNDQQICLDRIDRVSAKAPDAQKKILLQLKERFSRLPALPSDQPNSSSTSALFTPFKKGLTNTFLQTLRLIGPMQGQLPPSKTGLTAPILQTEATSIPTRLSSIQPKSLNPFFKKQAKQVLERSKALSDLIPDSDTSLIPLKRELKNLRTQLKQLLQSPQPLSCPPERSKRWNTKFFEQCFAIESLEKEIKAQIQKNQSILVSEEHLLSKYGNKHKNLMKMSSFCEVLGVENLSIPKPHGLSTDQMMHFLKMNAPEIFTEWKTLETLYASHKTTTPFLETPQAKTCITKIQSDIKKAFQNPLQLPSPFRNWLEQVRQKNSMLMVRSTGAEDSHALANAGGNISRAYVSATLEEFTSAVGDVIGSYFSTRSLQNRINGGMNPFTETLSLAVTAQELVGEPVGGTTNPQKIPISFVAFSNEPLYIGTEKFRAMRVSACLGHGEGVVSGQGIGADTILILHSESHPDEIRIIYNNQPKIERLAPQPTQEGGVSLEKTANPVEMVNKPAMSQEQILNLYQSALMMEGFFGDHPTDIEGVIQNGQLYFVQARPVNRKPLLPTYLKDKTAVTEKLQLESLVPGRASAITIQSKNEVLFAPNLEAAERMWVGQNPYKLVIVTQPEPENSHPVVNFSSLGVPCLYAQNEAEAERFLESITKSTHLVACMQTATLNLWDSKIANLEDSIQEGFAVHPAKVAMSLKVKQKLAPMLFSHSHEQSDLQDQLIAFRDASGRKSELETLKIIENHPLIQNLSTQLTELKTKLTNLQWPVQEIFERVEALELIQTQTMRAIEELRAVTHQKGDQRLKKLLHLKVLETVLIGTKTPHLGSYSLLDTHSLYEGAKALLDYQAKLSHPSHLSDLLLDGAEASLEAFDTWKDFLGQLEPQIEKKAIRADEVQKFKSLIKTLNQSGAMPLWLTFFLQKVPEPGMMQYLGIAQQPECSCLREILSSITPSSKKLFSEIAQLQPQFDQMALGLDRFQNLDQFDHAWSELEAMMKKVSDPEWLTQMKSAPPIVKTVGLKLLEKAVTTLDNAVKAMKASPEIPNQKKPKLFKQMILSYAEMTNNFALHLAPLEKIPAHTDLSNKDYLLKTHEKLIALETSQKELRPSRDFSVSAAMLGSTTAMSRHWSRTLEDFLTLSHQNALVCITSTMAELLDTNKILNSQLPSFVIETMQTIESLNWEELNLQRTGIEVTGHTTILKYNVPLRNHSSQFELHFDMRTGQITMKGKLLGPARSRWEETIGIFNLLEHLGVIKMNEPSKEKEMELFFSWDLSSKNTSSNMKEFMRIVNYSLSSDLEPLLLNISDEYQISLEDLFKFLSTPKIGLFEGGELADNFHGRIFAEKLLNKEDGAQNLSQFQQMLFEWLNVSDSNLRKLSVAILLQLSPKFGSIEELSKAILQSDFPISESTQKKFLLDYWPKMKIPDEHTLDLISQILQTGSRNIQYYVESTLDTLMREGHTKAVIQALSRSWTKNPHSKTINYFTYLLSEKNLAQEEIVSAIKHILTTKRTPSDDENKLNTKITEAINALLNKNVNLDEIAQAATDGMNHQDPLIAKTSQTILQALA